MMKYTTLAIALGSVALAGCKDTTGTLPLDSPRIESLTGQPLLRSTLQTLATGVLAQDRSGVVGTPTYMILASIMGRTAIRLDASEPRYVGETLATNPDPGSFAGGGGFAGFYTAIRAANSLLNALPGAADGAFTPAEGNATKGFIKTIQGLDYMRLIELRDTVGIPIQDAVDNDVLTAVSCKTPVLNFIGTLLDEANTDLTAAGAASLPFVLPSGFTTHGRNYSTVANIQKFNRAVKGKVDVLRAIDRKAPSAARAADAITELTFALGGAAAGAVPSSTFSFGPYYHFVIGGSEATPNNVSDTRLRLNTLVKTGLEVGDTRGSKIISAGTIAAGSQGLLNSTNITCAFCGANTSNQERPLGILRDEELVLLRAQAYIETGNFVAATADINSVRTVYGLAPYATFATKAAAIAAVVYEKRYSLLMEGPQTWVDLREYGLLTSMRKETATDPYNAAFPISRPELNARQLTVNPACTP
ncbi:MAG: RagB/SusD family nutrient uptake outer membrane protein [Gemmatimonadales bacterium]